MLIGDALDLQHRLPRLWAVVQAGTVPAWQARAVAKATKALSVEAAAAVDAKVAGVITTLPWSRFDRILETAVLDADPIGAERRAELWAAERFVRIGSTQGNGYKVLVARAAAGEVIWFDAMVARIAQILAAEGDPDPVQIRRSKAIGILAQPALALDLLLRHQGDDLEPTDPGQGEQADQDHQRREGGVGYGDEQRGAHDQSTADHRCDQSADDPTRLTHRSVRFETTSVGRIDPRAVAPKVVLHVHLSADALRTGRGVARLEGSGPMVVSHLRQFLGTHNVNITVRPVLDTAAIIPVDCYEIPGRMAETVRYRSPVEVFPFGTGLARTPWGAADLDHTIPWLPPNRGGWSVRQPESGVFVWRSPHGHVFTVDAGGTRPHGSGAYARMLWQTVLLHDAHQQLTQSLTTAA